MPDIPALAIPDIQDWTGDRSYSLGRAYVRQGALGHLRREGMVIKGRCQGTASQPYRVQITLNAKGIASGFCSCPVGGGGRCKHCAALLLAWIEKPDAFVAGDSLDTMLERLDKAELLALLRRMVKLSPDTELLLENELPLLLGTKNVVDAQRVVDPQALRRQVVQVLRGTGGGGAYGYERYTSGWHAYGDYGDWDGPDTPLVDSSTIQPLVNRADSALSTGDVRNAANMYVGIAEGIIDYYDRIYEEDEEGELYIEVDPLVQTCIAKIGACLRASSEPAQRESLVRALAGLYQRSPDADVLSTDEAVVRVLVEDTTREERWLAADLIRASLLAGDGDAVDPYLRRQIGQALLRLEHDRLDDEAYLRLCRETGLLRDLVERLLSLQQVDEAVAEVQQVEDVAELVALADLLRAHGESYIAENLIRRRARTSHDPRLTAWLKERAEEAGDVDEALGLAERLFWRAPTLPHYQEVKDLAQRLGTWDRVVQGLRAHLEKDKQYALLTEIYLLEGEIDAALTAVKHVREPNYFTGWNTGYLSADTLQIRVAQAAEDSRPDDAIRLYEAQVKRLIENRKRDSYAIAATYLARVRDVFRRQRRECEWDPLIARYRADYKRLPALQDELRQAHL